MPRAACSPAASRHRRVRAEPSVGEVQDAVGDRRGVGLVRDDHDGAAREPSQELEHRRAVLGVEAAGRLVGEDQLRVVDERASEREALLLAAGELVREVIGDGPEPELVDQPRRAPRAAAGAPGRRVGSRTFSAPLSSSISWNCWKTKPTCRRRIRASRADVRARHRSPATVIRPVSGVSRPPSRFSSVDFPLPERPRTATTSPGVDREADAVEHASRAAARADALDEAFGYQNRHTLTVAISRPSTTR